LHFNLLPGALFLFFLAMIAIVAGIFGLFQHYMREKDHSEFTQSRPGKPIIYRSAPCRVEPMLLEKLARALTVLHQQAGERHWDADWQEYEEHHKRADEFKQDGDLAAAFCEYCRAMLPLTQALGKHRHKEESFQPVWDKG
jgi:hypothetical protein